VWSTCEKSEAALVEAGFPEDLMRDLLPAMPNAATMR
jgi:hypothetical protein